MNENIRNAFGDTPEVFKNSVHSALTGLEERTVTGRIRRPVVLAIAAILVIMGIAFAAGSTRMFEVFGKTPIEGAEQGVVDISGEPIKVNNDITATVDSVYYDGSEIFYEMTLTVTDPETYALIDASSMTRDYTPPTDITHIYLEPRLWDSFEIYEEFENLSDDLLPVNNPCIEDQTLLEDIGNGSYKLYGYSLVQLGGGLSLPEEMNLDVNLHLVYSPQESERHHLNQQMIDTQVPFYVTRAAVTREYILTPVNLPEGWTMDSATLEVSAIESIVYLDFSIEDKPGEIYDAYDMTRYNNLSNVALQAFCFYLHDPNNPDSLIWCGGSGSQDDIDTALEEPITSSLGYEHTITFYALNPVPERLTFDIEIFGHYGGEIISDTDEVIFDGGEWIELPVTTLEFTVTEAERPTVSARMFEVFEKTPLKSAEQGVVDIASEPIKVNNDITATVDSVYYDGSEIFYEMTLTVTDPETYALIDKVSMPHDYTPPTDITHIYLKPELWDDFEIYELFDETPEYLPCINAEEDARLEDIGNGAYKLYGYSLVQPGEGLTLPDELDLDVNLQLIYAPQEPARLLTYEEMVDAEIPFHASKTAETKKYLLTPVSLPEGWTMHSAILEVSAVDSIANIEFSVEREPVEVSSAEDMVYYANRNNFAPHSSYGFMLHDPNDPENLIWLGGSGSYGNEGTALRFDQDVTFKAMDPIPEKLTFTLTQMQKVEGIWNMFPYTPSNSSLPNPNNIILRGAAALRRYFCLQQTIIVYNIIMSNIIPTSGGHIWTSANTKRHPARYLSTCAPLRTTERDTSPEV